MPEPLLAITAGEPAGIGPDIIAELQPQRFDANLVIIGDRSLLQSRAASQGKHNLFTDYGSDEQDKLQVIDTPLTEPCVAGTLDRRNANYVLSTLQRACNGCLSGEFAAMVTAPVQKETINDAGFAFSGHTEYLAELCGAEQPVMLLLADTLRVALVTTHLPLRAVADAITADAISRIVVILDEDLHRRFGLDRPHIKVCGLNPHAGENGYLGREELDIIIPTLDKLRDRGLNLSGPYPADTLFTRSGLADADAVLAMYHDQGLPVLKHVGFHNAVNTTLGLPIIRTSVDHGTALDLAGTNRASAGSLVAAIHSAIEQASHWSDRSSR